MSRPVSKLLLSAAILVAMFACATVARGGDGHRNARAEISQAGGQLTITNSRNGQAIFQASGLAPGRSVTGTVQLSNTGTLAGDLRVAQVDLQDQPGVNGGRLSDAVQLAITDITGGSSIPVYGGQLNSVGTRTLGKLAAGTARTYRFTASLPNNGTPPGPTSGDNAYIGSRVTLGYVWTATAPTPAGPLPPAGGGNAVAPVVTLKVVSKKLLKRGQLDLMTTCDVACSVSAYAQLPKVKAAKKARKGKKRKKAKALKTRRRNVTLAVPNKAAKIRLKVSKKARKQLTQALRKKKRVALVVRMTVTGAAGGPATNISRKVVVKRPKPKKKRRR